VAIAVAIPPDTTFVTGAMLGGEAGGLETREKLEALLLGGEQVVIATGGSSGGALFTNLRLILVSHEGFLNKRLVVRFFRADAIRTTSIDADKMLTLEITGPEFGSAHLTFEGEVDPAKLARWCAEAMLRTGRD
jgi:hypothetical protein